MTKEFSLIASFDSSRTFSSNLNGKIGKHELPLNKTLLWFFEEFSFLDF